MGTLTEGVDRFVQTVRQKKIDDQMIQLRQAQEERLGEQTRAAKAKQDELDRVDQITKSADAAGAKVLDGYRAEHILNGGDQHGYIPDPEHMAEAYRARGDEFLKANDLNGFLKSHAEGSAARAQVRSQLVKDALSTGDMPRVMMAMNRTTDNGVTLTGVQPIDLPTNGQQSAGQAFKATYKYPDGSERSEVVTANDISKRAAYVLSNPAEIAKQELAYDLNRQKAEMTMREQDNKGANDRQTENLKTSNDYGLEATKNRYRLGQIGAEGVEQRKTASHKSALDLEKPVTLSEGQDLKAPVKQKDGSIKYETVARGRNKQAPGLSDKQVNEMVIDNFGVLDPGTGRQVGSDMTAKVSSAASRLMAANPGLDANTAIVQAAQDLGLQAKAKK